MRIENQNQPSPFKSYDEFVAFWRLPQGEVQQERRETVRRFSKRAASTRSCRHQVALMRMSLVLFNMELCCELEGPEGDAELAAVFNEEVVDCTRFGGHYL